MIFFYSVKDLRFEFWYANVHMRIRELEMLVFRKILPTYLMDDPFPNVYFSSWNILWKTTDFLYLCKTKPTKRNNIFKPNIRSFSALNIFVKLTHCMLEMTFGCFSHIFKILGNTNGRVGVQKSHFIALHYLMVLEMFQSCVKYHLPLLR